VCNQDPKLNGVLSKGLSFCCRFFCYRKASKRQVRARASQVAGNQRIFEESESRRRYGKFRLLQHDSYLSIKLVEVNIDHNTKSVDEVDVLRGREVLKRHQGEKGSIGFIIRRPGT